MPQENRLSLLSDIVDISKKYGASDVSAFLCAETNLSQHIRLGKLERSEASQNQNLSIRLFKGTKSSVVSSSDFDKKSIQTLIQQGLDRAETLPEDPFLRLATPEEFANNIKDLNLYDPQHVEAKDLICLAKETEESALAFKEITNSEGATATYTRQHNTFVTSQGFSQYYEKTFSDLFVCLLAGNTSHGMERDYEQASTIYFNDLPSPKSLGEKAALRTIKRLGAKQYPSQKLSVIFEHRTARTLLSHFLKAINGKNIVQQASFLKDSLHKQVFSPAITIEEDPFLTKGLRSRTFDGEGLTVHPHTLIDKGILKTWLTDLYTSKQLNVPPTGHSNRHNPSPSNVWIQPGEQPAENILKSVSKGVYITDLFGQGVNLLTGDYSRGFFGYWIENGEITSPISEMTVAGNLREIFQTLIPANDLTLNQYGIDSPTLFIPELTIGGC